MAQLELSAAPCEGAGWRFKSSRSHHFFGFVAQLESERKNSTLEVAGSNPAEVFSNYFGFVQLAGRLTLDQEIEVRILDPKPVFSGCSADGYTGFFWKEVFAGSNPATQTNFRADVV